MTFRGSSDETGGERFSMSKKDMGEFPRWTYIGILILAAVLFICAYYA